MIKSFVLCFLFAGFLFVVACGRQADNTQESYVDVGNIESNDTNTLLTIPDLPVQIKVGDFSSLIIPENDESLLEQLKNVNTQAIAENYEWVEFDVNGDGINELILQASDGDKMQRIVAIFAFDFENSETSLVYFHTVDLLRFLFLSENGNLIWYHFSYGVFNWNSWNRREFTDEWNITRLDTLIITYIYCLSEMPEDWQENNPDMAEQGVYFHRYSMCYEAVREILDEYQFLELFEEMMGFPFYYAQPDWWQIAMLEESTPPENPAWMEAYADFVINNRRYHPPFLMLLDVDFDDIPELFFIQSGFGANMWVFTFLSYSDNGVTQFNIEEQMQMPVGFELYKNRQTGALRWMNVMDAFRSNFYTYHFEWNWINFNDFLNISTELFFGWEMELLPLNAETGEFEAVFYLLVADDERVKVDGDEIENLQRVLFSEYELIETPRVFAHIGNSDFDSGLSATASDLEQALVEFILRWEQPRN